MAWHKLKNKIANNNLFQLNWTKLFEKYLFTTLCIIIKGDLLFCLFLQYVIYVSSVPRMCLWSFSSKYPTDNLIYHEIPYFEWKQKHVSLCLHVSLNANELLLPAPFSRTGPLRLIPRILHQKTSVWFYCHVYCTKIMCFKPY